MDHPRISIDPAVMSGRPVVSGRRVLASSLLTAAAYECDLTEAAKIYGVNIADVQAALFYAAEQIDPEGFNHIDDLDEDVFLPAAE